MQVHEDAPLSNRTHDSSHCGTRLRSSSTSSVVARKMKRSGRHRKSFDRNPCRPSAEMIAVLQFGRPRSTARDFCLHSGGDRRLAAEPPATGADTSWPSGPLSHSGQIHILKV